jgi:hypothetical protein
VFIPKKHTTISAEINLLIIHTEPLDKFLGMIHVFRQLIIAVVGEEELRLNSHEPGNKSEHYHLSVFM